MPPEMTLAEQAATFTTATFQDGEASDGSPTAEEQAAAAADAPVVPKVEAKTPEGETEDDAEAPATPETKTPADAAADEAKAAKGGKKTASERIGDLTAARRVAERDAAASTARAEKAERELAELKSGTTPLTAAPAADKSGAVPPDPSQFDYGELDPKYIAALARHETLQALKAEKAKDDKTRQADAAAVKQQEQATKSDELAKAGAKLFDDFDEVVMEGAKTGKWQLSQEFGELLVDSEFGPQIAYELASDPDEAERIYRLSPAKQAAHFGRMEGKFEAAKAAPGAKTPKAPQAPPPPKTPKGGSGSNTIEADSTDFAAVEKAWRTGGLR